MNVELHCRKCGKWSDGHWTLYPNPVEAIMHPYCLYCKAPDVVTFTDEDVNEPKEEYYDEED